MTTTTLTQASNQLMTRPKDERYPSLDALHLAVKARRSTAVVKVVPYADLRVVPDEDGDSLAVVGKAGIPASLTNWSFGQLAARVQAPASYLSTLKPETAALALNEGLVRVVREGRRQEEAGPKLPALLEQANRGNRVDDEEVVEAELVEEGPQAQLLFARNGSLAVRAFTSTRYTRIWDADVTSRLLRLSADHPEWQPAPAAFDGSRGLYASDRDVFAFLVDNNRRIFESDPNGGLARGFMVANSEVGASSFWLLTFLYEYVCGNHRVWGAQGIAELRIRHVGDADDRVFGLLAGELKRYSETSEQGEVEKIERARRFVLGRSKEEVLDRVFGLRVPELSRKLIAAGYERAEEHESWYGNPRSAWGLAGGLTEVARELEYADRRTAVDRAAGKVMELAF